MVSLNAENPEKGKSRRPYASGAALHLRLIIFFTDSVRKYGGLYSIAGLKEVLPCIETHSDIIVTEKKLSALKGAHLFYPRQRCVK